MFSVNDSLHEAWDYIKNLFVTHSKEVADFLKPYWSKFVNDVLIDAAKKAVDEAEASGGTGVEKMTKALAVFSAICVQESIEFIETEARALIEIALLNKKIAATDGQAIATGTN